MPSRGANEFHVFTSVSANVASGTRQLGGAVRERDLPLLRQPVAIAVPPHAGVERQASHRPGVVQEGAEDIELVLDVEVAVVVVLQSADVARRGEPEDNLARAAVGVLQIAVAADALGKAGPLALVEDLAAELERVAALGGVDEIGGRGGVLLAIAIVLLALRRAFERQRRGVTEPVAAIAVGNLREVVAEVAVARLDVQLVAHRPVPFALVHPAARILAERLAGIGVKVRRLRQAVRLHRWS